MSGGRRGGRPLRQELVEESPLRRADPRAKLALSLGASLTVMLPLERLVLFMAVYAGLLLWARLLPAAARQVWRMKWILAVLFVADWLLVGPDLAVAVCLRLILLAGAFSVLFATTTPGELRLALEALHVPYRYAFSLSVAFQAVNLLDEEWRTILEAQRARGAWPVRTGWRDLRERVRDLVALSVPAVMLAMKRAWTITEAAYARGFDSPQRRPYRRLAWTGLDWALLAGTMLVVAGLFVVPPILF